MYKECWECKWLSWTEDVECSCPTYSVPDTCPDSKLKLWIMTYTLDCVLYTDRMQSGVWSTTKPTAQTLQRYWDKIHPDWHTVKDFSAELAPKGYDGRVHILERQDRV